MTIGSARSAASCARKRRRGRSTRMRAHKVTSSELARAAPAEHLRAEGREHRAGQTHRRQHPLFPHARVRGRLVLVRVPDGRRTPLQPRRLARSPSQPCRRENFRAPRQPARPSAICGRASARRTISRSASTSMPASPIEELSAQRTRVATRRDGETLAHVELAGGSTIPNRDFVLKFRVAGEQIKSNLLTYTDAQTTARLFHAARLPAGGPGDSARGSRSRWCSSSIRRGSMSGQPLAQARAAINAALERLDRNDTFHIMHFSSSVRALRELPDPRHLRQHRAGARLRAPARRGGRHDDAQRHSRRRSSFPRDAERTRFVDVSDRRLHRQRGRDLRRGHSARSATRGSSASASAAPSTATCSMVSPLKVAAPSPTSVSTTPRPK